MGFRQAAVLAPVSFFLGVLFICFNVDHRVLWGSSEEFDVIANDGFQFYTTFFNAPPAIKALLHGMSMVGILGLVSKLHEWNESAVFFDGTSLAAYVFAIVVYLTVTITSLRTIAAQPTAAEDNDRDDQVMALRVLSAGNVIIIGCLFLILALQAGQEWARRQEAKSLAAVEAKEKRATAAEKKDQ